MRFSMLVLSGRQNFSMATNFMRKIYSVKGDDLDSDGDAPRVKDSTVNDTVDSESRKNSA